MDSVLPNARAFGGTSGRAPSRRLLVGVVVCTLAAATAGCTLNFDQFDAGSGGDGGPIPDAGDDIETDTDPPGDIGDTGERPDGADGDGGPTGPTELIVGRECQSDDDCYGDATCVDNYCTIDCRTDRACPGDNICEEWAGRRRCLIPCSDSCPSVEGRLDLRCGVADRQPTIGDRAGGARACLPDGDGDFVTDRADNCPRTPNARQLDRDLDGDGDACDEGAPRCHPRAVEGTVDFGSVTYPATDASIPEIVGGSFVPVVGGRHQEANYGEVARLDLRTGEWTSPTDLPYSVSGQGISPLNAIDRYAATPGESTAADTQRGRFVLFGPESVHLDGPYGLSTDAPVMATDGPGNLYVLGARNESGNHRVTIWRYRPEGAGFQRVYQQDFSDARDWRATRGIRGDLYFYSTPVDRDESAPEGRVVEFDRYGSSSSRRTIEYPEITPQNGSSRPMDPVLVPGPGLKRMYAFDRGTGRAGILDYDENDVVRESELDVSLPFDVEHVAVAPDASALVMFGRDESAPDDLRARALYADCHPAFLSLNSDGDSIQDLADNCPTISNSSKNDADEDRIGDACDDDADNDGIPNADDFRTMRDGQMQTSLDTDNDGVPNSGDDDDDGDGIPDTDDRWPYDTDDDELPNHIDSDDDDDGYADTRERESDADHLDRVDFPQAGYVAYVRRTGSGDRTVEIGPLTNLESATEVVPDSHDPHRPRLFDGANGVVALAGDPGEATSLVWWTDSMGAAVTHDAEQLLYDVVPGSVDEEGALTSLVLARRPTDESTGWSVSDYTIGSNTTEPRIDAFQTVASVDRVGSAYAVVGGPADCTPCLSLYSFSSEDARPRLRATPPGRLGRVHYDGSRYGVTSRTEDGSRHGFLVSGGNADSLDPPEAVDQIASVVPLRMDGHILISAKADDGSYDIWLFNGRKQRWHRMSRSSDDLLELDWMK